jgi:hypothetical protein
MAVNKESFSTPLAQPSDDDEVEIVAVSAAAKKRVLHLAGLSDTSDDKEFKQLAQKFKVGFKKRKPSEISSKKPAAMKKKVKMNPKQYRFAPSNTILLQHHHFQLLRSLTPQKRIFLRRHHKLLVCLQIFQAGLATAQLLRRSKSSVRYYYRQLHRPRSLATTPHR